MIILGKTAGGIAHPILKNQPDYPLIIADTFKKAMEILDGEMGDALLVSRDFSDISEDDLAGITRNSPIFTLIWPPDSLIEPFIWKFLQDFSREPVMDPDINELVQSTRVLIRENEDLTRRIGSLEAVVRSLISALSQYEPVTEAYADNEDAWNIIMKNMPSAGVFPEDSDSERDGYDKGEDYEEEFSDEQE